MIHNMFQPDLDARDIETLCRLTPIDMNDSLSKWAKEHAIPYVAVEVLALRPAVVSHGSAEVYAKTNK